MFGGERELVALLGKLGELVMGAEVSGVEFEGLGPAFDAGAQRSVDVFECLFGGGAGGGIAGLADPVEDAAGLRLLFGFVAKECVLEGDVGIGLIQAHSLAELVAGGFGFADFEQGVGEVLANGRSSGGGGDRLFEKGDGLVVIPGPKELVGFGQRGVGRIAAGGWRLRGCQCAEHEGWDCEPHIA